jgi:transcriptional regulator with PAS, ATPase and Fis domain
VIELIARSDLMREVLRLAERVAATDSTVLISGESGTGKDTLAAWIHDRSARSAREFVKIDCAALPAELIEAELFGYERGAFTGATEGRPGRFEAAHKGTLLLDEIAHLTTDAQAKLLRVIETREFERLGGRRAIKVDARLIALTNVDLRDAIRRGAFREDLYYRLNVVNLHLPALVERTADVEPLSQLFLTRSAAKHGRRANAIAPDVASKLAAYSWPGNIRELANTIERAVVVSEGEVLRLDDFSPVWRAAVKSQRDLSERPSLAQMEAAYVAEVLAECRGNKSEAARILGISRKNLYERLDRVEAGMNEPVAGG